MRETLSGEREKEQKQTIYMNKRKNVESPIRCLLCGNMICCSCCFQAIKLTKSVRYEWAHLFERMKIANQVRPK